MNLVVNLSVLRFGLCVLVSAMKFATFGNISSHYWMTVSPGNRSVKREVNFLACQSPPCLGEGIAIRAPEVHSNATWHFPKPMKHCEEKTI